MRNHSYKSFIFPTRTIVSGINSVPPHVAKWPAFSNIEDLANWWFGDEAVADKRSLPVDIRSAVIKTMLYIRQTECSHTEEHWQSWWDQLKKLNLSFQAEPPATQRTQTTYARWRGWVRLSSTMPDVVKAEIAKSATQKMYQSSVLKLRTSWKWALPHASSFKQKLYDKTLLVEDQTLWTALVAIHKAKDSDFGLLRNIWRNHDQKLGLPIATMALVYLPKTKELQDLLADFSFLREEPMTGGGALLAFEVVYRMHAAGWLPETPPTAWTSWCKKYINSEKNLKTLGNALSTPGIPWSWKFGVLIENIKKISTIKVFSLNTNAFIHALPSEDAPYEDRLILVKTLLEKLKSSWDSPASSDIQELRENVTRWCGLWLPEHSPLINMWTVLDLNYQQTVNTLVKPEISNPDLPSDLSGSIA